MLTACMPLSSSCLLADTPPMGIEKLGSGTLEISSKKLPGELVTRPALNISSELLPGSTILLEQSAVKRPPDGHLPIDSPPTSEPLNFEATLWMDRTVTNHIASPAYGTTNDQANTDTIVVTAQIGTPPGDPFNDMNFESFEVVQNMDKIVVRPAAMAYEEVVPKPVRSGIRNFLRNLTEPIVFLNYLLQLKPGKALETFGRFAINTTVGIGGLVDVAEKRPFNLPYRSNGFANTLGYYGVKPGPYLFLPLVGPTTLRDLIGGGLDLAVLPVSVGKPFNQLVYTIPAGVVRGLDSRIEEDDRLAQLLNESDDPYAAMRDSYLDRRQTEIDALRGKVPAPISSVDDVSIPIAVSKDKRISSATQYPFLLEDNTPDTTRFEQFRDSRSRGPDLEFTGPNLVYQRNQRIIHSDK